MRPLDYVVAVSIPRRNIWIFPIIMEALLKHYCRPKDLPLLIIYDDPATTNTVNLNAVYIEIF